MRIGQIARIVVTLCVAAALAGCSLVESQFADSPGVNGASAVNCATELAAYSLPKTNIEIAVASGDGSLTVTPVVRSDRNFQYCLEFSTSPLADEGVQVKFNKGSEATATPFLQSISSNSVDETALVIRKLIRLGYNIAVAASVNREAHTAAPAVAAAPVIVPFDFEVDPFDGAEMAARNAQLAAADNYCVVLEGFSFKLGTVQQYCSDPVGTANAEATALAVPYTDGRDLISRNTPGIYFRPRAMFTVDVYQRPGRGGKWTLLKNKPMPFENISPVLSAGVDRAFFATEKVALVFNDGDLQQVCVQKGSEAVGFISIPIEVVYAVVGFPAAVIKAQVSSSQSYQALYQARQNLVNTQLQSIQYLQAVALGQTATAPTASGTVTIPGATAPTGLTDYTGNVLSTPTYVPVEAASASCNAASGPVTP